MGKAEGEGEDKGGLDLMRRTEQSMYEIIFKKLDRHADSGRQTGSMKDIFIVARYGTTKIRRQKLSFRF